jgi:hypothetical protein
VIVKIVAITALHLNRYPVSTLRRVAVTVIVQVHDGSDEQLAHIRAALDTTRGFVGSAQCRNKHGGEDCDDGNHHEQLD